MKKVVRKTTKQPIASAKRKWVLIILAFLIIVIAGFAIKTYLDRKKSQKNDTAAVSEPKGWVFDCKQGNTGLESLNFVDIAVADSSQVLLSTRNGTYRSLDGGTSWHLAQTTDFGEKVYPASFHVGGEGSTIYAFPYLYYGKANSPLYQSQYFDTSDDKWGYFPPNGIGSFDMIKSNSDSDYVLLEPLDFKSENEAKTYKTKSTYGGKNNYKLYTIGKNNSLWNFQVVDTPYDGYITNINNMYVYTEGKINIDSEVVIEVQKEASNMREYYYLNSEINKWEDITGVIKQNLATSEIFQTGTRMNSRLSNASSYYQTDANDRRVINKNYLSIYLYSGKPEIDAPGLIGQYKKYKKTVINGLPEDAELNKIKLIDINYDNSGNAVGYSEGKGVYACSFRTE